MSTPFISFHFTSPLTAITPACLTLFIFTSFLHSSSHSLSTTDSTFSLPHRTLLSSSFSSLLFASLNNLRISHLHLASYFPLHNETMTTQHTQHVYSELDYFLYSLLSSSLAPVSFIYPSLPLSLFTALTIYFRLNSSLTNFTFSLFVSSYETAVSTRSTHSEPSKQREEQEFTRTSLSSGLMVSLVNMTSHTWSPLTYLSKESKVTCDERLSEQKDTVNQLTIQSLANFSRPHSIC